MTETVECVVIGAGVVGLAIARAVAEHGHEVVVLERAGGIGSETSSRNSEVIHAGIYYRPESLKAHLCRTGKRLLYDYAAARGIPYRRTGKLIVAATADGAAALAAIRARAAANGVDDLTPLTAEDIGRLEPEVSGAAGLFSPSSGIIDSHQLMLGLQGDLEAAGGTIAFHAPVEGGSSGDGITLRVGGAVGLTLRARTVINAAGLGAQAVARGLIGVPSAAIPPQYLAIGHYYALSGCAPFRHLVYPLPEAGGLGIHVTLDLGGAARFGPDLRWIDRVDYHFDDSRRAAFISAIRSYYPALDPERLQPGYTGIRPKIAGPGDPDADFRIDGPEIHGVPGLINLFGIESPGLTAALAIGATVGARVRASRAA